MFISRTPVAQHQATILRRTRSGPCHEMHAKTGARAPARTARASESSRWKAESGTSKQDARERGHSHGHRAAPGGGCAQGRRSADSGRCRALRRGHVLGRPSKTQRSRRDVRRRNEKHLRMHACVNAGTRPAPDQHQYCTHECLGNLKESSCKKNGLREERQKRQALELCVSDSGVQGLGILGFMIYGSRLWPMSFQRP